MPVPLQNPQVVGQGLARLTSAFITKPNVRAWLAAILRPWQDLENAAWQVYTMRLLATATQYTLPATNAVLDSIGSIVGQSRDGLGDADYVSLILLRIAVNRATGRITDWSGFGGLLLRFSGGPLFYWEGGARKDASSVFFVAPPLGYVVGPTIPAQIIGGDDAFVLFIYDMELIPVLIAGILAGAVPNGERAVLGYTQGLFTPGARGDLRWSSAYDNTAGNGTFGSVYSSSTGGTLAASLEMN